MNKKLYSFWAKPRFYSVKVLVTLSQSMSKSKLKWHHPSLCSIPIFAGLDHGPGATLIKMGGGLHIFSRWFKLRLYTKLVEKLCVDREERRNKCVLTMASYACKRHIYLTRLCLAASNSFYLDPDPDLAAILDWGPC